MSEKLAVIIAIGLSVIALIAVLRRWRDGTK